MEKDNKEYTIDDALPKQTAHHRRPRKSWFTKLAGRLFDVSDIKNGWIFWLDVLLNIIIIVAMVVVIRTFIISPFQVYGPSMCDTLNNVEGVCQRAYGEYLIVNKFGYLNFFGWKVGEPQRGDIIVFHPPQNDAEFFIKRVIGLPGETVKLKEGKVYIYNNLNPEGFALEEEYLNEINSGNTHPYNRNNVIFEVPQNHYFVMGDNRVASSDSRSCFQETASDDPCNGEGKSSFLTLDHIEGKAWIVLWPINKISFLKSPQY